MACITSLPSIFTPSKPSYSHTRLSFPFKSFKSHVSCPSSSLLSLPSLFSLKKEESISRISVIAALQEEGNPVLYEEDVEGKLDWGISGSEDSVADAEEAKLYVGNLPYDIDSEGLADLFNEAGVVEISQVIYDRESDRSKGFAFVTMSSVEEAEKAIEMFNRYDLNGRLLTVNKAAKKGERPPRTFAPASRVYVGSLPWSVDDARLEEVFSEYGKVVSARVVIDRESGRSRGFGFVVMSSESEMNDAIANLDGQSLDGRAIRVNVAEERPRRSF